MRTAYLKHLGAAFLLGALCLLAYANSLHHDFMIDDYLVVLQDHKVNNIKYFFDHFIPGQKFSGDYAPYMYYRPLAHITVLFNRLMFGDNPFGYHFVNLLLFYC